MKHTLLNHLYSGIFEAKKQYDVLLVGTTIIIHAGLCSINTSFNFTIMKYLEENNKSQVINWIIYSTLVDCFREYIEYLYSKLFQTRLKLHLKQFFTEKYLKLFFLQSNHDWLNCNKSSEINTAINSGTSALINSLYFSINVFNPLLQAIGSIWIIAAYTGIEIIIIFIILILTFIGGVKLLQWEYNKQEEINKITNPLYTYNTWLTNTILPAILNNLGLKTIKSILSNSTKNQELNQDIRLKTMKGYTSLEIIGNIAIITIIYIMSPKLEISVLVSINVSLTSAYNKMWWLFHMFHNAASNAAEWSSLELYLESYVVEPYKYKCKLDNYQLSDKIKKPNNEYQLCGKSGTGKSTFMLKEVMNLYRNYQYDNFGWLYLPQETSIPKSTCITINEFLCKFIKSDTQFLEKTTNTIIHWASFLQLSNVINLKTLNKPFTSPSGGEEKRIYILQMLLPIFLNELKIKLLFLDEITSGLDDETHEIVRKLLDKLKTDYNITIINIDHHKYDVGQTKLNLIKVKDGTCPWKEPSKMTEIKSESWIEHKLQLIGITFDYNKNQKEENKKELSFPPEIIIDTSM